MTKKEAIIVFEEEFAKIATDSDKFTVKAVKAMTAWASGEFEMSYSAKEIRDLDEEEIAELAYNKFAADFLGI